MLGAVLLFAILAGVDNLETCSAVGFLPIRRARKLLLALSFTICETVAPIVGLAVGHFFFAYAAAASARIGPCVMLTCGIAILFSAHRRVVLPSLVNGPGMIVGLPVALSFDNLLAGAGISSLRYPVAISALLIGLVSAAMSCIGLYLGAWVSRLVPRKMEFAVGLSLCFLAGRTLLMGGA
ncbi:MAG TPA: manganese efflux pump [Bryobacteraceae bacterium]